MKKISISDVTLKTVGLGLSFRQKLELAKALDRVGVSVIETSPVTSGAQDVILVKSLASAVKDCVLCVPVEDNLDETWTALSGAAHPRLQVSVPVSTVRMEYVCRMKSDAVVRMIGQRVKACSQRCSDVEFVAEDFARADRELLLSAVSAAVENGATTVTLYDSAGMSLDFECLEWLRWMRSVLPEGVRLGYWCSNELFLADSCAFAAVRAGANEVKTSPYGNETTSLKRFVKLVETRQDIAGVTIDVKATELPRTIQQIKTIADFRKSGNPEIQVSSTSDELTLSAEDDRDMVIKAVSQLGYDLDTEDEQSVYDAFLLQAGKTGAVTPKELDAIARAVAFQAPAVYRLESYLINSGNGITSTCHIKLKRATNSQQPGQSNSQQPLECVALGDGPVDAAFKAIEQLVGTSYELDDFQIQSVTRGSKALGGAIVSLRHDGRLFTGRGVSSDIVEASIMAYLNALNKILAD